MLTTTFLAVLAAIALLACGWYANAWFYKRRIAELQQQLKAVKQMAADHAQQAKRQVGQLQAELARRPPVPRPAAEPVPSPATAAAAADPETQPRRPRDGFAPTMILE